MTAIVRFAVTTERKQTSMEKSVRKGPGSHWQITRPREPSSPLHRTKPGELQYVKVVTFLKEHLDLVRDLKRKARKHYDRSHSQYSWEKLVILLSQFRISVCFP